MVIWVESEGQCISSVALPLSFITEFGVKGYKETRTNAKG
jgi:hypothetical protein